MQLFCNSKERPNVTYSEAPSADFSKCDLFIYSQLIEM